MYTKENVAKYLKDLLDVKFSKEVTRGVLMIFNDSFEGHDPNDLMRAMRLCAQTKSYGSIDPSDILDHLKPSEADLNVKALEAIGCLQRAIESENMEYVRHDPVLLHMAHSERRLEQLGQMTKTEFQFYLNRCRKDYVELSSSEQGMKALEMKQKPTVLIQDVLNDIKALEESK